MPNDQDEMRLSEAAKQSMETRQMTPIIKEELRLSIIKKRHASGQDEIKVEFPEPKQYELTEQEKEKKERRRKQNREAARRCRQKKKRQQNGSQVVFSSIVKQNGQLKAEVKKLRKERRHLDDILIQHVQSGKCRQTEEETVNFYHPESDIPPTPSYCDQQYSCAVNSPEPLPSFNDVFTEHRPIKSEFDQYATEIASDLQPDRSWSFASDDVIPPENLPEIIFDALDTFDDVFYDNSPLPEKTSQNDVINTLDFSHVEENWSHLQLMDVLSDPGIQPLLPNEP